MPLLHFQFWNIWLTFGTWKLMCSFSYFFFRICIRYVVRFLDFIIALWEYFNLGFFWICSSFQTRVCLRPGSFANKSPCQWCMDSYFINLILNYVVLCYTSKDLPPLSTCLYCQWGVTARSPCSSYFSFRRSSFLPSFSSFSLSFSSSFFSCAVLPSYAQPSIFFLSFWFPSSSSFSFTSRLCPSYLPLSPPTPSIPSPLLPSPCLAPPASSFPSSLFASLNWDVGEDVYLASVTPLFNLSPPLFSLSPFFFSTSLL